MFLNEVKQFYEQNYRDKMASKLTSNELMTDQEADARMSVALLLTSQLSMTYSDQIKSSISVRNHTKVRWIKKKRNR